MFPSTPPHQINVQITIEAMKSDIDEVALQGIEFWSNVCDEEMDLAIEASEVCWVYVAVFVQFKLFCFHNLNGWISSNIRAVLLIN